jgi:hypothetical protein
MRLHPLLTAIFLAWNEQNLRWALLRLPSDPAFPSGDIDVLIHPDDQTVLSRILAQHGFSSLSHQGYGSDRFYLAYHRPTDHWLWLHLTSALAFGPFQMYRTDLTLPCLGRRIERDSVCLLHPDDALWVLLLHCLLDKGVIAHRHRLSLSELAHQISGGGPFIPLMVELLPPGETPDTIVTRARQCDWAGIEAMIPLLIDRSCQLTPASRQWLIGRRSGRLLTHCLNLSRPVLWRRYLHRRHGSISTATTSEIAQ